MQKEKQKAKRQQWEEEQPSPSDEIEIQSNVVSRQQLLLFLQTPQFSLLYLHIVSKLCKLCKDHCVGVKWYNQSTNLEFGEIANNTFWFLRFTVISIKSISTFHKTKSSEILSIPKTRKQGNLTKASYLRTSNKLRFPGVYSSFLFSVLFLNDLCCLTTWYETWPNLHQLYDGINICKMHMKVDQVFLVAISICKFQKISVMTCEN